MKMGINLTCNGPADRNMILDVTEAVVKMEILFLLGRKKTDTEKATSKNYRQKLKCMSGLNLGRQLMNTDKHRLP